MNICIGLWGHINFWIVWVFSGLMLNWNRIVPPEKDLERPSSTPLEDLAVSHDSRVMTSSPRHAHGDLTCLAPHERLPEVLIMPREKTPMGAAA